MSASPKPLSLPLGLPAPRALGWADRLDAAGHVVLAALPAVMVAANRSAALVLACGALLVVLARLDVLRAAPPRLAPTPRWRLAAGLALAALVYALASIGWSVDRPEAWRAVVGVGVPASASLVLLAAWRARPAPAWAVPALAGGIVVGACLIVMELRLGYPIRRHFSDRLVSFVENRPTLTLAMLLWPVGALVTGSQRHLARLGLAAAVLAASATSTSGASKFGLAVGLATLAVSCVTPRWTLRGAIALLLVLTAVQPWFGDLAGRALPHRVVEASEAAHPRERIEIWQSYGDVARRRLAHGIGLGAAGAAGRDPVAGEVAPEHRAMLDVGHPHDALLQVWVELGLPGALALAGAILAAGAGLARLSGARRHAGVAALMAASAVCLVDHDAWQAWWWGVCGLGAALLAFPTPPAGGIASAPRPV